ncbi:unnamed protein product [Acanthosepion pharaonis]|uniref:Uncharacterized protein n=1 Tax=Acanthosepion pharaonis TaxID=158019 RepID=A0A812D807_ACAPH|nr:unnamed protein product [Sepia pharaonis]
MLDLRVGLAKDCNIIGIIEIGDGAVVANSDTREGNHVIYQDPVTNLVEQDGGEHTSLADARSDDEGSGFFHVSPHPSSSVSVVGLDEVEKLGREAIMTHDVPEAFAIHRVECCGEINEAIDGRLLISPSLFENSPEGKKFDLCILCLSGSLLG